MSQNRRLLSPLEAGEIIGVRRSKIHQLLREGQIRSFKLGRLRKIPADAIADFIEKQLAAQGKGREEK